MPLNRLMLALAGLAAVLAAVAISLLDDRPRPPPKTRVERVPVPPVAAATAHDPARVDEPAEAPETIDASPHRLVIRGRLKSSETALRPMFVPMAIVSARDRPPVVAGDVSFSGAAFEVVFEDEALVRGGYVHLLPAGGLGGGGMDRGIWLFRDPLAGSVDLGEVALGGDAPVLVAGTVVRPDGRPVEGARVSVSAESGGSSNRHTARVAQVECGGDGRFVVHGIVRGAESMTLELEDGWAATDPVRFIPGDQDVRVTAHGTSTVRGSIEVTPGMPLDDLVVVVTGTGANADSVRVGRRGHTKSAGYLRFAAHTPFWIDGLPAGSYDFHVRFREAATHLATLREVEVRGQHVELAPLLVLQAVRGVSVRIVGPGGGPPVDGELWIRGVGDRGGYRRQALDEEGLAEVAVVAEALEIAAHAKDSSYEFVTTRDEQVTLHLRAREPIPVTIELPADMLRESKGWGLHIQLRWAADPSEPRRTVRYDSEKGDPRASEVHERVVPLEGHLSTALYEPGWYWIKVCARRDRYSTRTGGELLLIDGSGEPVSAPLGLSRSSIQDLLRDH